MSEEYNALAHNGTWKLVPSDANHINKQLRDERIKETWRGCKSLAFSTCLATPKFNPANASIEAKQRKGVPRSHYLLVLPDARPGCKILLQLAVWKWVGWEAQEFPEDGNNLVKEGQKPDIYTEQTISCLAHVKQLEKYLKMGTIPLESEYIIRQKTLGHCTHCSKCGIVQGQYCEDCLYKRYGEHVLEAKQNHD
ncbi:uncharacterized protein [Aristolochia californica]|uniref:uncharacterized protein n=1 Tax=Aristolochia californica TaxID=171875 RepID=UPI0035E0A310